MTATTTLTAPKTIPTPRATDHRLTPVWRVGAVATVVGAAATELFGLVARGLDVPMHAADPGASAAKDIPVGGLFMAVVMNAAVGVLLAVVLARRARRPARTFAATAVVLTALSLLGPAFAAHTELATKVVLAAAHVVAAAVIVPPLTARLRDGRVTLH
jgi:hypothetical protein